jgi:hypothetical protein
MSRATAAGGQEKQEYDREDGKISRNSNLAPEQAGVK